MVMSQSDGLAREKLREERRRRLFEEARRVVARKRVDGYIRVSRIGGRAGDGFISPRRDHGLGDAG
jgi:hypothetical protein